MLKKQTLIAFSLLLVIAIVLSSCAPAAPATEAPATEAPATEAPVVEPPATEVPAAATLKIGFLAGVQDPFYTTMQRGAAQAAIDLGVELITQIPQAWNVTDQTPMLDAMVSRGDLDFLFLAPVDKNAMIAPLQAAYDSGLPLLTVDTYIGDGDYLNGEVTFPLSFIASDNFLGGQIACRALADALGGTGKVYIQNVKVGISSTDAREAGCKDVLAAEYPNVTLVGVDYNDDDATKAQAQVEAMLQSTPDLGGIFGTNVFSAQGAGTVVQNKGLSGIVKVVAFDATSDAINMLTNGTVDLVIAQKPSDMGYLAVAMAVAYLNGVTSIPKHIPTGYAVITRDNMADPNVSQFFYAPFDGNVTRKTAGLKIGFLAGVQDPFYITMQRGAQVAADAFGAELITQIPQA